MHVCILSRSVMSDSLQPHGLQPTRPLCPWNSPGKNTGVGCHSLLQGNLPNPGIEPGFPVLHTDSLPSELCVFVCVCVCVLVTQLCLTLCDYMDCSQSDSSIHGILQARTLEWVTTPFSRDLPNNDIHFCA